MFANIVNATKLTTMKAMVDAMILVTGDVFLINQLAKKLPGSVLTRTTRKTNPVSEPEKPSSLMNVTEIDVNELIAESDR